MVSLVLFCLLGFNKTELDSEARDLLSAIANDYDSNNVRIAFGQFWFDYVEGATAQVENARSGKLDRGKTYHGYYVFDGTYSRYERMISDRDATPPVEEGRGIFKQESYSVRVLFDGKNSLVDRVFVDKASTQKRQHMVNIDVGGDAFFKSFDFPLGIGHVNGVRNNLSGDIRDVLAQQKDKRFTSMNLGQVLENNDVVQFSYTTPFGRREYWIDIKHGCIPRLVRDTLNSSVDDQLTYHDDVRQISGGWLPFQKTLYMQKGAIVRRLVVTNVDLVTSPSRKLFALQFDEPEAVNDVAKGAVYKGRREWDLSSLPAKGSSEFVKIKYSLNLKPPVMPEERATWRIDGVGYLALAVLIVVSIASVIWLWRRRHGHI